MKRLLALCGALLCGSTATAQSNHFTLSLLQPQFSGKSVTAENESIPFGMKSQAGFALEASHGIGRTWFAIKAARFSSPLDATFNAQNVRMGSLTLTPISATVAFHGGNERVDPYIGGGAAWVMTGNLHSSDLSAIGLDTVVMGDDFTYVANAGINFAVSPSFAVNVDAQYMPVSVSAHAADSPHVDVKFKTTTIGVGLQWKF